MAERKFKCYMCAQTFQSGWSEADAEADYEKTFGKHLGEKRAVLCDVCNDLFRSWWAQLDKSKVEQ